MTFGTHGNRTWVPMAAAVTLGLCAAAFFDLVGGSLARRIIHGISIAEPIIGGIVLLVLILVGTVLTSTQAVRRWCGHHGSAAGSPAGPAAALMGVALLCACLVPFVSILRLSGMIDDGVGLAAFLANHVTDFVFMLFAVVATLGANLRKQWGRQLAIVTCVAIISGPIVLSLTHFQSPLRHISHWPDLVAPVLAIGALVAAIMVKAPATSSSAPDDT